MTEKEHQLLAIIRGGNDPAALLAVAAQAITCLLYTSRCV